MSDFVKIAQISSFPDTGRKLVEVGERLVVLVRAEGQFFCVDDVCTHDGGPLGNGQLCGFELVCPRHGARFDVRSGKALTMPATEDTVVHQVRIKGDDVYVKLNDA